MKVLDDISNESETEFSLVNSEIYLKNKKQGGSKYEKKKNLSGSLTIISVEMTSVDKESV